MCLLVLPPAGLSYQRIEANGRAQHGMVVWDLCSPGSSFPTVAGHLFPCDVTLNHMGTESERARLRDTADLALRAAKEAFAKEPQAGTPEWDEWQRLFRAAIAANDDYICRGEDRSPR